MGTQTLNPFNKSLSKIGEKMGIQTRIIDSVTTIITEYTTDYHEVLYILRQVKRNCLDNVFQAANEEMNR